ncbi:DNA repair protein RecO [Actinocrinis sp.]|uniref:DNA repair protein RecO n=1 Tax=Actinocrinis sp. TaxID=1920516 RepID=UPI002C2B6256|nr:DNA repair protein RecO [Actinocrinis sp.]HXR71671.1 DNA repair protein RecO [Actinocrinis sp.]
MSLHRADGIVLRTQKLGEADRIITILTREQGRVRLVAKGVRRTTSKFGARLEPFAHVDFQVFSRRHQGLNNRSLDMITQAETIAPYGERIVNDYSRYTAGTAMLETAERLTDAEGEPAVQQYLLLLGGLRALTAAEHAPGLVLDAFILRSMAVAGYAPSFYDCAQCGAEPADDAPWRFFAVAAGGVVCPSCKPPASAVPQRATLDLLGALLAGEWETADASEERHRREGSGLVAAYLQWHVERGLRSLRLVER